MATAGPATATILEPLLKSEPKSAAPSARLIAPASPAHATILERLHLSDADHPAWATAFPAGTRCEQIEDDLFAARTVGGVLLAIVAAGAIFGAIAVLLAVALW